MWIEQGVLHEMGKDPRISFAVMGDVNMSNKRHAIILGSEKSGYISYRIASRIAITGAPSSFFTRRRRFYDFEIVIAEDLLFNDINMAEFR